MCQPQAAPDLCARGKSSSPPVSPPPRQTTPGSVEGSRGGCIKPVVRTTLDNGMAVWMRTTARHQSRQQEKLGGMGQKIKLKWVPIAPCGGGRSKVDSKVEESLTRLLALLSPVGVCREAAAATN